MKLYARHGDLVIEKLDTISGDLAKMVNVTFGGDSSGHPHTLMGTVLGRRDGLRTFVRLDKSAKLVHGKADGHRTIDIEPGDYEVRPLRERGDGTDRAVED